MWIVRKPSESVQLKGNLTKLMMALQVEFPWLEARLNFFFCILSPCPPYPVLFQSFPVFFSPLWLHFVAVKVGDPDMAGQHRHVVA